AIVVRYVLDNYLALHVHTVLQVGLGIVLGGVIYAALVLLTERPLLRKLLDLVRRRKPQTAASLP
ncbi:MAG: lipopolysaccharide biosynthesis protein, partial [Shinella sp.]